MTEETKGLQKWMELAGQLPGIQTVATGVARGTIQRLVGFWLEWHLFGGLEAMVKAGVASQSSAYRQRNEFYAVFGVPVDQFAPDMAAAVRKFGPGGDGDVA